MFKNVVRWIVVLPVLLLVVWRGGISSWAQTEQRIVKIKRDVRIMEGILEEMLSDSKTRFLYGEKINGFYLPDYGLVFTIDVARNFGLVYFDLGRAQKELERLRESLQEMKETLKVEKKKEIIPEIKILEVLKARKVTSQKVLEEIDQKVLEFLETYVDIPNHLKENEKIAVILFLDGSSEWEDEIVAKLYKVNKAVIRDYRLGRIGTTVLSGKVQRDSILAGDKMQAISIMAKILRTAFASEKDLEWKFSDEPNGVYFPDYGVLFSFRSRRNFAKYFDLNKFEIYSTSPGSKSMTVRTSSSSSSEKFEKRLDELQDEIIQKLGTYGSTLRFLPAEQWLVVVVNFRSICSASEISDVLIRIKKQDILDYAGQKINWQSFKKRAQVMRH